MAPQQVTERYIRMLLVTGKNDRYEIVTVGRQIASVDNIPVGSYYGVAVAVPTEDFRELLGIGATPSAALRRALEKDGVTFRG